MEWLDYFIYYIESTPTSKLKVLLLDSHTSHHTLEFTILTIRMPPPSSILRIQLRPVSVTCLELGQVN